MNAQTLFSDAMARFEQARAAELEYDVSTFNPACDAQEITGGRIPEAVANEAERLTEIRCDAENALIAAPAPNLAAVIWKIDYARPRWADFCEWPESWWDSILADLRRLDGAA